MRKEQIVLLIFAIAIIAMMYQMHYQMSMMDAKLSRVDEGLSGVDHKLNAMTQLEQRRKAESQMTLHQVDKEDNRVPLGFRIGENADKEPSEKA